ncbi:MAG: methyltransferase [Alphaproteobacteria bacterium]|nr:methyltransferase [Alphaproteobacteria bacterium]
MSETTDDTLLGGAVALRQFRTGYRAAIDPVLLAAAVPEVKQGETVVDFGVGAGAALLCYLARVPEARGVGVDSDPAAIELAQWNFRRNAFALSAEAHQACVTALGGFLPPNSAAQVMANPPYLSDQDGTAPPHASKRQAHVSGSVGLADWIDAMLLALRPKGGLTLIHRADRVDRILGALAGRAGAVEILPIRARAGADASRVIIRARKGVRGPARLAEGLILHDPTSTEKYTPDTARLLSNPRSFIG